LDSEDSEDRWGGGGSRKLAITIRADSRMNLSDSAINLGLVNLGGLKLFLTYKSSWYDTQVRGGEARGSTYVA
jgi:hypothetical protein